MSRGRGRGRGRGGARREMTGLQSELMGSKFLNENTTPVLFPEYEAQMTRESTNEEKYISVLMSQFQSSMQASVFYLHAPRPPADIERYSDRFISQTKSMSLRDIQTDISLFPEELQRTISKRKIKRTKVQGDVDGVGLLDRLSDDSGSEDGEKAEGEEDEEEEEVAEEEEEEEDDYMATYFDNGEGDDMGDGDDGEGVVDYY
ncbi:hypothetical protein LPJ77_000085 [Coemansia sp. RSA 2523]|nr:hypothetical protein LPJ58_003361 [Coemansia sp. RSA 1591]KAJ1758135.1 hypothetical protein LPJ54_006463 [Coemansia sp. RSA 1824]KAJ1760676.1 hypothetical protein LPJ69_003330 [Coemansia sp. RSA 1752]KAJ1786162.1 hypothetical protein LPJ62_003908 [Coemansia sp. RSA 2167]KAJ1811471.1 hypothetical protein LPJ77_000085 [Coemansia sp. RSA 2523]KAJ2155577.1 hypothetical protein J3F82_000060 [Coemansia sp. RSA 637]KAJ2183215.1 hypothetical protein GGF45_000264 [Coemansia sp. RSA 551]KAJ2276327.